MRTKDVDVGLILTKNQFLAKYFGNFSITLLQSSFDANLMGNLYHLTKMKKNFISLKNGKMSSLLIPLSFDFSSL